MAIARGLSDEEFRRRFFEENPDFFKGGDGGPVPEANIAALGAQKRDPQFRRLLASGQLLPVDTPRAAEVSSESRLRSALDAIGSLPLAQAKAEVPAADRAYLDAQRRQIKKYIDGVRSGAIQPITTSPEQRSRLIERAEGDFGRLLDQSQEGLLGDLSRRGILGTGGGFSGLAAQALGEQRSRIFEDPLSSFIRDLDIQTEADRVARARQNQDTATALQQGLLGDASNFAQFLGNLGLGNLNSQRGFTANLLGQTLHDDQFSRQLAFDQDRFEREQAIVADQLLQQERQARGASNNAFQSILGSLGGTLLGGIAGPIGSAIGGKIGGSLFGRSQPSATVGSPLQFPRQVFGDNAFESSFSSNPFSGALTLR